MERISRVAAWVALAYSVAIPAAAQDWSRFRGPNGSGVVEALNVPVEFGVDKNAAWSAPLPFGSSSPVLAGGAVFVTGADDAGLITVCLDRASGEERWRRTLERTDTPERFPANDSASPTPVTDGENVYAFFPERGLVSYDAQGEQRWLLPLGPFVSFYGMSASPILAGDTLVLLCDQQRGSFLIAVDRNTGKQLWRTERKGIIESWTTPVLYTPEKGPQQVVTFGTFWLHGYSVATGEELWSLEGLGYTPVCSPVLAGSRLFASVPYHAEQPMPTFADMTAGSDEDGDERLSRAELESSVFGEHFGWADADKDDFIDAEEWAFVSAGMSSQDYGLVAVDLSPDGSGAKEVWRHKKSLPSIASPLVTGDVVFLVKDGGIVSALDAATGELKQRERLPDAEGEYWPSPVAAGDKLYIAGNAGKVFVLAADASFEVLATNEIGEEIFATPALGDGEILVRTRAALHCYRTPPAK